LPPAAQEKFYKFYKGLRFAQGKFYGYRSLISLALPIKFLLRWLSLRERQTPTGRQRCLREAKPVGVIKFPLRKAQPLIKFN